MSRTIPPDAGGRPLVRLDGRRVVVRLDLEDRRQPVAYVHHARVLLAGLRQQARAVDGKRPQQRFRMLIPAVLAPKRAEQPQLQVVRLTPQPLDDGLVLGLRQRQSLKRFLS